MNTRTPAAAVIAGALGASVVVVTLVASCSLSGGAPPPASAPPASSASDRGAALATGAPIGETVSHSPAPAPTATTAPAADLVPSDDVAELAGASFTTRNGTATFAVPEGWTARDTSVVGVNHGGDDQWVNQVVLLDEHGRERVRYQDGYLSDVGWGEIPWALVEQRPIAQSPSGGELAATAWWMQQPGGELWVMASVTPVTADGPPNTYLAEAEGRFGVFSADVTSIAGCEAVTDASEAEACLSSPAVLSGLAVLASVELHDVPWDAMP